MVTIKHLLGNVRQIHPSQLKSLEFKEGCSDDYDLEFFFFLKAPNRIRQTAMFEFGFTWNVNTLKLALCIEPLVMQRASPDSPTTRSAEKTGLGCSRNKRTSLVAAKCEGSGCCGTEAGLLAWVGARVQCWKTNRLNRSLCRYTYSMNKNTTFIHNLARKSKCLH